jgi:8-amino-7-oxononanoate synthase
VVVDHRLRVGETAGVDALAREMERRAAGGDESWLVVTDSVFSMDGTVAPLSDLCDIVEEYDAWIMVDEAHATGLYEAGGGIVQRDGLEDRVHVQMGTLSKALASQGGYVAGDETLIEYLVNAARSFVFSTGLAPPAAAAAREALRVTRESDRREALWENVAALRDGLVDAGHDVWGETQILPVVVGDRDDALALADAIRDRGVVAPAIRPPTVPEGTSRIRVAPMATHDEADVARCLDVFRSAGREVGLL